MFASARRGCARSVASASIRPSDSIPTFLLPAFQAPVASRAFATTSPCRSKIAPQVSSKGKKLQELSTVQIKGPLGELSMQIPAYVNIDQEAPTGPTLTIQDPGDKKQRAMWGNIGSFPPIFWTWDSYILGTTRAYLHNHILGVSEGHSAILSFVGVGYRASVETTATTVESEYPGQQFVNLKVGFSHPVELGIPKGIKASTPQPTRLLLEGTEKEVVMQFAAIIRKWRILSISSAWNT